jgi:hypothetical protein
MNINEINEYAYNRADSYSLEQRRDFFKSIKEYTNHSRVRIPTFELPENGQNVIFQAGSGAVFLGEYINGRFLHLHGSYCIGVVLGWTELPIFPKEVEHVLFHKPDGTMLEDNA